MYRASPCDDFKLNERRSDTEVIAFARPQEYLAIGEAPDEIRNAFQQRSRWCKGHF